MYTTKFKLDSQGIEISGSETFVESQIERFTELIQKSYEKILENSTTYQLAPSGASTRRMALGQNFFEQAYQPEEAEYIEVKDGENINYENVFVNENGKIQLIADVPGNTISARMINVILIVMWAKLKQGIENVSFADLREVCANYGAFDRSNFSRHMDNNKKFFILFGDGQNKSAKLIRPGIKEAERLIVELNEKNK